MHGIDHVENGITFNGVYTVTVLNTQEQYM